MKADIDGAVAHLMEAHRSGAAFAPFCERFGVASLDGAYAVQEAFLARFGAEQERVLGAGAGAIAGYKIALTSKAMQEMCGVDQPLAGALLAGGVLNSPAVLDIRDYGRLGLEFELAVRMGEAMGPEGAPWTRADVADRVEACLPAFELIDDRKADYSALSAFDITADKAWNAGVVLGVATGDWRALDLAATPVRLDWAKEPPATANTGDAMGHPFEAVAWIANLLARRGRALEAGQIVMTGSTMKTRFPAGGEHVTYTIEGLGEVTVVVDR